jgi:hypothetical protein
MNFFERRKILKSTNAFDLVPVRTCEHETAEDGKVTVLVPKFKNPRVAKFMLGRKKNHIYIHLDEFGSFVWLNIDGIRNIRDISQNMQSSFGDDFAQAGERVNKFMSRLYQERYINFRQLEK